MDGQVYGRIIEAHTSGRGGDPRASYIIVRWAGGVLREYAVCIWGSVGDLVVLDGDTMQYLRPATAAEKKAHA